MKNGTLLNLLIYLKVFLKCKLIVKFETMGLEEEKDIHRSHPYFSDKEYIQRRN